MENVIYKYEIYYDSPRTGRECHRVFRDYNKLFDFVKEHVITDCKIQTIIIGGEE